MKKILIIVESPAKKKKIEDFLNNNIKNKKFIVEASYGHIRYFSNGLKSINIKNNFEPKYSIVKNKYKVAKNLINISKNVNEIIIATDPDREGEAIGFHVAKILNLNLDKTKRISFNEITKEAIVDAYNNPGKINLDLFYAQQSRSILDILIGFEISPILWKHVRPNISAGRCQSPALKIIYENEEKIKNFKSEKTYIINGIFDKLNCDTEFIREIKNKKEILKILPSLIMCKYKLMSIDNKLINNSPSPPFITSSIQQEASVKLGLSPKITMSLLQKMYEKGKITYMRTDSTSISKKCMKSIEKYCNNNYPGLFNSRKYNKKVANAQEAHECIRPVNINADLDDSFNNTSKKLYSLLKNRIIASQMKKSIDKKYIFKLQAIENEDYIFNFSLLKNIEIGYKIIYKKVSNDNEKKINSLKIGSIFIPSKILSTEKNTKPISRFTEASLIKELENKGIGRPSTFSSITSKLLERGYVFKENKSKKEEIIVEKIIIENKNKNKIKIENIKLKSPSLKNKLILTDLGKLVTEFMNKNFPDINSYTFTSEIENDLDKISRGEINWVKITEKVYNNFHKKVVELKKIKKKINKLGVNPINNKNIYIYNGKYGYCIQEGEHEDKDVKYIGISDPNISLNDAIKLMKYPKNIGKYNGSAINIKNGKYGYYIDYKNIKISVKNPNITEKDAILLIDEKNKDIIKEFKEFKVIRGKYGVYIKKGKKNISIPGKLEFNKLTKKDYLNLIKLK
jgi:DNA topoisomerase I